MGKPWTEEEIQILREGYQAKTPRKLLLLKRSTSSINHKAWLLDLRRKNISQEEKEQIRALRDQGKTVAQIMAETGRSKGSIGGIVSRKNKRWTQLEIREIRRLWREGKGRTQIAARFSTQTKLVNPSNINRFIQDLPAQYRRRSWTIAEEDQLRGLWAGGLSPNEIGKHLNRPGSSVRGRAHLLGLEKQP